MKGPILITILLPALLVGMAFWVRFGKAYWLIAGYNTAPEDEKRKVDVEKLARVLFWGLIAIAAAFCAGSALMALGFGAVGMPVIFLLFPIVVVMLGFAQRCGKEERTDAQKRSGRHFLIGISVAFAVLLTFVFSTVAWSSKQPTFSVQGGELVIRGNETQTVSLEDVTSLSLRDTLPKDLKKQSGSDGLFSGTLSGQFTYDGGVFALVYAHVKKPPFIFITTPQVTVILSRGSAAETQALYAQLQQASGK